jgi:membrane-bound lytic murein transglycosylase D
VGGAHFNNSGRNRAVTDRWLGQDVKQGAMVIADLKKLFFTAAVAAIGVAGCVLVASAGSELPFPKPTAIDTNVQFWLDTFTKYGERDFAIHDRDDVSRVYQVLHLPGEGCPSGSESDSINNYLKHKYTDILTRLATGQKPANYEERQVADMFAGQPLSAYSVAAQNLRVQQGMRERFREGLLRSRNYRPTMERIFAENGLPPELVTLAGIESGFYIRAHSDAGAVGVWQFTRPTGKQFMRISRYHDDRLDPTTETEAAAKLLRSNYLTFDGNWPLAITAYNYGTGGMQQASEQYNGDYGRIVKNYSGPHFGFASKNYYSEFLAAVEIHQNEDKYFPELKYLDTPPAQVVRTDFAPKHRRRTPTVHRAVLHRSVHHRRRTTARRTTHKRDAVAEETQSKPEDS